MKKILMLYATMTFLNVVHSQGTLSLSNGTHLSTNGGVLVVLGNLNLVNDGTIVQAAGDGTFRFIGSDDVILSGTGITTFDRLLLEKGNGSKLSLSKDINIITEVFFNGGLLNFNNSLVHLLGNAAFNNESPSSRSFTNGTGYADFVSSLNAPSSANPGNLGAIITSSQNLGNTIIRRGHKPQTGLGTGSSIFRFYDINVANNTGLNATLRLQYSDAELNGLDETALTLWKSTNGTTWTNEGFTSRDTASNYVEKTGINGFSLWTLSSSANALPVRYTYVNTECSNNGVILNWQTAQELNASRFEIERSSNGTSWSTLGQVNASGNSNTLRSYSFADNSPGGVGLYRIAQVDFGGHKTYSGILKSSCRQKEGIEVRPNPVHTTTTVQINSSHVSKLQIQLYDVNGRLVITKNELLAQGTNIVSLDLTPLPVGAYTLKAQWNNQSKSLKITKQ
ncbi:MAG TPA: T9SS type A sorting domain-containing protein [Segetibacter sp.]|jgi:hypothetical protein